MLLKHFIPSIVLLEGLTGNNLPIKPPDKILVMTALPTLPVLFDAPNTATLEGEIKLLRPIPG
jgi:hypothetical protein